MKKNQSRKVLVTTAQKANPKILLQYTKSYVKSKHLSWEP